MILVRNIFVQEAFLFATSSASRSAATKSTWKTRFTLLRTRRDLPQVTEKLELEVLDNRGLLRGGELLAKVYLALSEAAHVGQVCFVEVEAYVLHVAVEGTLVKMGLR